MSNTIQSQHPAVVLRSHYRQVRSLLAVAMIALVGLSTTVVVLAVEDSGSSAGTSASFVSPSRAPVSELGDPLQARTQGSGPAARPDESAVAAAITQPKPPTRPDESRIAATIGR